MAFPPPAYCQRQQHELVPWMGWSGPLGMNWAFQRSLVPGQCPHMENATALKQHAHQLCLHSLGSAKQASIQPRPGKLEMANP